MNMTDVTFCYLKLLTTDDFFKIISGSWQAAEAPAACNSTFSAALGPKDRECYVEEVNEQAVPARRVGSAVEIFSLKSSKMCLSAPTAYYINI